MQTLENKSLYFIALLAVLCVPAYATVQITALTPSVKSPQLLGTPVTWTVTATDSNPGPLTFQFNVAVPAQSFALVKDFNVGTLAAGTWTSQPFRWVPTGVEGVYKIEVVIKDFTSGETTSKTALFQVSPLATTTSVVTATANPLVALFSAPSCASGSSMAVRFQPQTKTLAPAVTTPFQKCHPPATMNFEIAGMYPTTEYQMISETETSGKITLGSVVAFTTGAIPTNVPIPKFTVNTAAGSTTDTTDWVLLQNLLQFGATPIYPAVATDLSGNIIWYYNPGQSIFLTRPLQNGTFLTMQSGPSWDPASTQLQLLDQVDFAGNIIKETNIGVLSHQLVAMGATDAVLCNTITAVPPPVGAACIDSFHHDAIQTLPNGDTAVLVAIEKIYPAGTQGDTTGLPVDIIGDMIIVMNSGWQVIWYFDTFQHATGAPQLDITRPPVLGETCSAGLSGGCPAIFLVTSGISAKAKDWLHANALYYWPQDKDIVMSMRNQDWVVKIDYNNGVQSGGLGTGNILWRMGPCGDFTFTNTTDPWPWFSHQHEFALENSGAGPITVFDNGNTRWSSPSTSTGCMPGVGTGNSRGMALNINESALTVSPVLSQDMGYQSFGDGSAQLLSDGNYSFLPSDVFLAHTLSFVSYIEEILPTAGTDTGTQVLNIQAPQNYRIWRMPSMYKPPIT